MNIAYEINDPEFGKIPVNVSQRAKRVIFKVRQGVLFVTIGTQNRHSKEKLLHIIEENREALRRLKMRAASRQANATLHPEQSISFPEGEILLEACNWVSKGTLRIAEREPYHLIIYYHEDSDTASPLFQQAATRLIMRMMKNYAMQIFPSMVTQMASLHGLRVKEVRIGHGRGVLGRCTSTGIITISAHVMFLPPHLRQYIICHELAHLTHFNHSKAFHQLCDRYCGGNEKNWRRELLHFTPPIN